MSDMLAALIVDFLEWIAARPRPYSRMQRNRNRLRLRAAVRDPFDYAQGRLFLPLAMLASSG